MLQGTAAVAASNKACILTGNTRKTDTVMAKTKESSFLNVDGYKKNRSNNKGNNRGNIVSNSYCELCKNV